MSVDALAHARAQLFDGHARARDADDRDVEMAAAGHRVERGKDLLEGEIAGGAEDDQGVGVRLGSCRPLLSRRPFDVAADPSEADHSELHMDKPTNKFEPGRAAPEAAARFRVELWPHNLCLQRDTAAEPIKVRIDATRDELQRPHSRDRTPFGLRDPRRRGGRRDPAAGRAPAVGSVPGVVVGAVAGGRPRLTE